jgi:cyanophycin synthetase
MSALHIERIEVGPELIEVLVRVSSPSCLRTSGYPGLPARALELLPGLSRHTCENGSAHGYIAELADTETPHLLEHVACELMALSGSPRTLRAETAWDFSADGPGVFHLRMAYDDDLVCLGALRNGVDVVEWLLDPSTERPDVARVVSELSVVRGREV